MMLLVPASSRPFAGPPVTVIAPAVALLKLIPPEAELAIRPDVLSVKLRVKVPPFCCKLICPVVAVKLAAERVAPNLIVPPDYPLGMD